MRSLAAAFAVLLMSGAARAGGPIALEGAAVRPQGTVLVRPQARTGAQHAALTRAPLGPTTGPAFDLNDPAKAAEIRAEADVLAAQSLYASDDAKVLASFADELDVFMGLYHPALSGTQVLALTRTAAQARALAKAQQTAIALGAGRAAPEVLAADGPGRPALDAAAAAPAPLDAAARVAAKPADAILPTQKSGDSKKYLNVRAILIALGSIIVAGVFGYYLFRDWMVWGAAGLMTFSAGLAGLMVFLARRFGRGDNQPAGVGFLYATAVALVPVFLYGALWQIGHAPNDIPGFSRFIPGWALIELGTIAAAAFFAYVTRAKAAIIALPAVVAAWFFSMDLVSLIAQYDLTHWSMIHSWGAVISGVVFLAAGRSVEKRTEADYPFWIYLAGLLSFTGGLMSLPASSEWVAAAFAAVHVAIGYLATRLKRATFLVFGAFGVLAYLWHLVEKFHGAPWFPVAAGAFGIALIVAAFKWETIKNWLKANF